MLSAITGYSRAGFKVSRIFQAITPGEAMHLHDAHDLFSLWREATLVTATRGNAANIYSQSRFVQRSAGPLGAIYAAPRAASGVISAAVDGLLFGARTESAVDLRLEAARAHFAHCRIKLHASVRIKRLDAI